MKKLGLLLSTAIILTPLIASAITIEEVFELVNGFLLEAIFLLITIATAVFIWGIIKYLAASGDEEKLRQGKDIIVYGIIGLVVIISVWGIVKLIVVSFGLQDDSFPSVIEPL